METANYIFTLTRLGLFLNLLGTIMVSFSFGKNPEDAHSKDKKGNLIYLASFLRPKLFQWGLLLIIFGFVFQLIETFKY